jgi:aspartate/tyrosine/aromatic aminotransferase
MSRFEGVDRLPRIPKYLFQERFAADPRPDKILASTGPYKNEKGEVPRLKCIRIAIKRIKNNNLPKQYLDVAGYQPFREAVGRFLFGADSEMVAEGRVVTAHTPGGTVALRIGAEFIKSQWPDAAIWVSAPTWGNHLRVFQTAGLTTKRYAYYDGRKRVFDIERLLGEIEKIPDGDVVFLQASTHNPTCIDPTPYEWARLAKRVAEKKLLPFFDVAFFGFSNGVREDLEGLMIFCEAAGELLIALSFSKSFAVYSDRVGAFSIVGSSREAALNVYSHIRPIIRANYSNPPLEGAAVITEILEDPALLAMWEEEIARIRARIRSCRERLVSGLRARGVQKDLSYVMRERGLFTSLAFSAEEIEQLREERAIHISPTGRLNVTAMTDEQMDRFCQAVSDYLS